jgi:hypothetical protein
MGFPSPSPGSPHNGTLEAPPPRAGLLICWMSGMVPVLHWFAGYTIDHAVAHGDLGADARGTGKKQHPNNLSLGAK